jgi:hypothetical protein
MSAKSIGFAPNGRVSNILSAIVAGDPVLPPLQKYYKLVDASDNPFVDTLDFEVQDPSGEYNGITITSLTNANWSPIENSSIVFVGHRVPTTITGDFVGKPYVETLTLTDADDDEISARKVYQDPSGGFETTIASVKYNVIYATGKYVGRRHLTIFFDNSGTSFGNGQKFARRILM